VIACILEEYKTVKTNLYMNSHYDFIQYKKIIRHYWYAELGGKELTENGQTEEYSGKKKSTGTTDTEKAMNTDSGHPGQFKFKCHKCGKPGHKEKDCRSNNYGNSGNSGRKKYQGKYPWCQKQGHSEERCFSKRNGTPRTASGGSSGGSSYGNSANNTTDDVA